MSELNVGTYASGLVGIGSDNQASNIDKTELSSKHPMQEEEPQGKVKSIANEKEVTEVVIEVNDFLQNMNKNLSFSIDEDLGDSIITIKDSESDEVIRQIPSEELLVIRKKMDSLVGVLFETKV